jgi:hypothetical protein
MRYHPPTHKAESARWRRIRQQLFGESVPGRVEVAGAFGLSLATIDRYEAHGPPAWYPLALEGLAARKRKGQPRG